MRVLIHIYIYVNSTTYFYLTITNTAPSTFQSSERVLGKTQHLRTVYRVLFQRLNENRLNLLSVLDKMRIPPLTIDLTVLDEKIDIGLKLIQFRVLAVLNFRNDLTQVNRIGYNFVIVRTLSSVHLTSKR